MTFNSYLELLEVEITRKIENSRSSAYTKIRYINVNVKRARYVIFVLFSNITSRLNVTLGHCKNGHLYRKNLDCNFKLLIEPANCSKYTWPSAI